MSHRVLDRDIPRRKFLEIGLKGGLALATIPVWLKDLDAVQGAGSGVATAMDPGLLERAIRKGLARGGDFAEVYLEKRISRFHPPGGGQVQERRLRPQPGSGRARPVRRPDGLRIHR